MKIYAPQITGSLAINGTSIGNFNNLVSTSSFNQYTSSISTGSLATTGSNTFVGNQTMSGSIIPAVTNIYDLGDDTHQFRHLYLSSGSLYINGTKVLGATGQELQITTDNGQSLKILEAGSDTITLQSADGNITLATSAGGDVILDPTSGIIALKGTTTLYAGNKVLSSDGNAIQFGNDLGITGSIVTTGNVNGINLSTFSSSIATTFSTIQSNTSSLTTRLNNIETFSSSVESKLINLESTTASLETKATTLATITASLIESSSNLTQRVTANEAVSGTFARTNSANIFTGNQTITGSLYISQDLIIGGSASIQTISSSRLDIGDNIIQLNVNNPSLRFGGIEIFDSGSAGGSGSFLYDSVHDEFIFVHKGNGTNVTSSHFVLGPETYDNLGNEIYLTNNILPKGTGKEHLVDSNITDTGTLITLGSNTSVSGMLTATGLTGSIAATNGVVSGSSQVIGILSSLNTYTGSNDTTNTAQNSRLTTIESVTGSYETKGRGIVSGSSQITYASVSSIPAGIVSGSSQVTLASTTGFGTYINQAVLTSSSPTFAGLTSNSNATLYRDVYINGGTGGNFGNRLLIGATAATYTIQDTNVRPTIYMNGAYPVLTMNHTATGNTNHGPTIQFTFDGLTTGGSTSRQIVIGTPGNGSHLDFGFSGGGFGSNTDYNPHRGIAGYEGVTPMRLFSNGLMVGSNGSYPSIASSISYNFQVNGTGYVSSNFTVGGTITENSSLRYKENIETIKYGLDKVLQMRGVTYDKKDNGVKELGVIAEEVYDILPEVVLKNEEGEIDSVSYGRIVGVLIEAIKEQQKQIEELKSLIK